MDLLVIFILMCGPCGALGNFVLTDCQVTTSTVNWTVSGSCRVQPNVSSKYDHNCTWRLNTGWRSFGEFDSDGELCSFTQPLEVTEGIYTYSIHFTPPSAATFSAEVRIVQPGAVKTSCPQVVDGGADLDCSCLTTKDSRPSVTVRWEGRDSEKLVKTNVQREDNGTQFTCHVTWAGRVYTSLTYTLIVNYTKGPDGVIITGPRDLSANASHIIVLLCSTTAPVYPGVTFTWTPGVCQNETHTANTSTCFFPSDFNFDQKLVTCTAKNSNNNSISVSTSAEDGFKVPVVVVPSSWLLVFKDTSGRMSLQDEKESHASPTSSTGPIIAAVFTTIAAAIITLVLIKVIRQRKLNSRRKQIDKPETSPPKDDDFEEHINVVYQSSENSIPMNGARKVIEGSNQNDVCCTHPSAGPLSDADASTVSPTSSPRFYVERLDPAISEEHLYTEVKDVNL